MKNIPFFLVFLFAYSSVAALFPAPLFRNPFTTNSGAKIVGAGSTTVSSNNAGTWTITGATTNAIATTNGVSRNLTNLGQAYSDRLTVTNLVVGTNTTSDSGRPPGLNVLTVNGNIDAGRNIYAGTLSGGSGGGFSAYQCCNSLYTTMSTDEYIPLGTVRFHSNYDQDLRAIRMGAFTADPGKAIQFTKTNGFLYLTSGDSNYANSTNRFHINQVNSRGVTVINSSTENVSITNGVINATKHISSGTKFYTEANAGGGFGIGQTALGSGGIYTLFMQGASGNYDEVSFFRSDSFLLGMMTFGYGNGAGTPALMVTNGNIFLGNATRTFNSGTTNSTTVAGLRVGFQAFSAVLTNTFTTNVVWDFPSTGIGAVADLGATITGVKDGDEVIVSPPTAAMTAILGSYTGFASNGVAYGRFLPLAAAQNPASGTFRVIVHQYR